MTAQEFAYWLQGFFELSAAGNTAPSGPMPLTAAQVDIIQRRLALVFVHDIDPKAGGAAVQAALGAIHGGPTPRC